ncbi:hypothetical protein [Bacillus cereus]|uniref:hypothetical protein n=1 Tax=Bacillus cereus TaxID=1396 RepID=UPI001A7E36B5|nr:hypothetical protein [Bacillus cereus]
MTTKQDIEAFSKELKERIENIETANQFDLLNLCIALYAAFSSQREYKKGWIIDAYWKVYNKCNSANPTIFTSVSGW